MRLIKVAAISTSAGNRQHRRAKRRLEALLELNVA
jgi:hypothetical protein